MPPPLPRVFTAAISAQIFLAGAFLSAASAARAADPAVPAASRPAQTPILAANSIVKNDIPYGSDPLQKLDLYAPAKADHAPVVLFIHGGEWSRGDKREVSSKPKFLNENGILFLSANYRLSPKDIHPAQANDVASAIAWTRKHAPEFGGDPAKIILMGYSAGCHLVALDSLDPAPLAAVGLKPSDIKATVEWSGAMYDLPAQIKIGSNYTPYIKATFGDDESAQRAASPIAYVQNARTAPPFLIAAVDDKNQQAARDASQQFSDAINKAGGHAQYVTLEGRNHSTANQDLGAPDDKTGQILLDFIHSVTR